MPRADGGFQRVDHGLHGIVAAAFERPKNRHQDGLRFRSRFALISLNHLAHNHRRANLPFGASWKPANRLGMN